MSFREWQVNGWLRPHKTSRQEIAGLIAVVERDLATSADPSLGGDWRFAVACPKLFDIRIAGNAGGFINAAATLGAESLQGVNDGSVISNRQPKRFDRVVVCAAGLGDLVQRGAAMCRLGAQGSRILATNLRVRVLEWLRKAHADLCAVKPSPTKRGRRNGGSSKKSEKAPPKGK